MSSITSQLPPCSLAFDINALPFADKQILGMKELHGSTNVRTTPAGSVMLNGTRSESAMNKRENNRRKWWILAAMCGVMGMLLLDETVVAVALPAIRGDLAMSVVASHWVINAYLLVFAGLTAFSGKLGDIFGERALLIVGVTIFGLASAACGLVSDDVGLISARAVQGVGAAIIFPVSLAMITIVFPPEQRGSALGIQGATGTVFLALGPLVGGFLVHVFSWRWIFWINPPIVIVIALVVYLTWTGKGGQRHTAHRVCPVWL
jgi:MFS family permease